MPQEFTIELTESAAQHLAAYKKFTANAILDAVKDQLRFQPTLETRNRKMLRDNPLADWELRVQDHRVFYEVDEPAQLVRIVAVGHKEHNKLFIAGEEFEL